jgi:hypothetical protein
LTYGGKTEAGAGAEVDGAEEIAPTENPTPEETPAGV